MEYIKNSIIAYDLLTNQFNELYPKINSVKFEDSTSDLTESYIYINNDKFTYNIVGSFDNTTNIWEWGWVNEDIKNKIYYLRELFLYGIEINDKNEKFYKNILINSKIKITHLINIDIILGYTIGVLNTFGFIFIYQLKLSPTITKYYILKPISK
jgi:hypothetical protein